MTEASERVSECAGEKEGQLRGRDGRRREDEGAREIDDDDDQPTPAEAPSLIVL